MKIVNLVDWAGQRADYIEVTVNNRDYWFTPTELINARARWIGQED